MSDLAFNINGEPFEVPATASGWRVRRMKLKGPPEVVYGRDGLPLVLPLVPAYLGFISGWAVNSAERPKA